VLLIPRRPVGTFGLPVLIVTFAEPMVGFVANAQSFKGPSSVVHDTVRRTCVSARWPAAARGGHATRSAARTRTTSPTPERLGIGRTY
jgi:hypothetical protein